MEVLGTGTVCFALGRDGGRDGRFEGTAQHFPSTNGPHTGKFIIQSKHTRRPGASCKDADFARIIEDELPRIEELAKNNESTTTSCLRTGAFQLAKSSRSSKPSPRSGIKQVHLIAGETITQHLTRYPNIWSSLGFDRYEAPSG